MNPAYRKEAEVFADLAALANSPGYVHAIAQICIRDNVTFYSGKLKAADLQNLYRPERLIRTEISTLLGLLAKGQIDFTEPTADILNDYVERTDSLMKEILDVELSRGNSVVEVYAGWPMKIANVWLAKRFHDDYKHLHPNLRYTYLGDPKNWIEHYLDKERELMVAVSAIAGV